ncbi:hypothetical protein [Finegoldia magna]|uniref:hypothetical protein n=1 Tax=Finegoldia magna TaxID=1260 RepID=UPI000B9164C3|nr:hypothetical protein [Finegoldia magna]OXZ26287.1 hypothetical protein B9N52_00145 [Finegoldia magna]
MPKQTFYNLNEDKKNLIDKVCEGTDVIVRAAIDGTSGIGHIILGVGIVWMSVKLYNLKIAE